MAERGCTHHGHLCGAQQVGDGKAILAHQASAVFGRRARDEEDGCQSPQVGWKRRPAWHGGEQLLPMVFALWQASTGLHTNNTRPARGPVAYQLFQQQPRIVVGGFVEVEAHGEGVELRLCSR